jgi:tRNA uridine 5-carboxymethylaminomethyl modification enzyme
VGEAPSVALAESLKALGFSWGRLKTGTPPRIARQSIDFGEGVSRGVFHVEHGDEAPIAFSHLTNVPLENRIVCHMLHTTEAAHDLVRAHIGESPLFNGQIRGIGPRYCPSFEDKVMRFPARERHQLFLEPEGLATDEIYVNGLSMSLPADVQQAIVRSLPGLETAAIIRPGYAVEYDFIQPTELTSGLAAHRLPGLFLAGQVNGTSGYEEAAGQGLVAGINAGLRARGRPPFSVGRDEAYLGVMIDDLVTKGCLEPYRMFTSRAEHRLELRIDNADLRLTPRGRELGLVDEEHWTRFLARKARFDANMRSLKSTLVRVPGGARVPAEDALRQPEIRLSALVDTGQVHLLVGGPDAALDVASLETCVKYAGYLERQARAIARARRDETRRIPAALPFRGIPGLSREVIERFEQVKPETLGQASRIPGVTPAAIAVLGAHIEAFRAQAEGTAGVAG